MASPAPAGGAPDRVDALIAEARHRVRGVTFDPCTGACPAAHLATTQLAAYLADEVERLRADATRDAAALAIADEWFGCCDCITTEDGTDVRKRAYRAYRRAALATPTPAAPGARGA